MHGTENDGKFAITGRFLNSFWYGIGEEGVKNDLSPSTCSLFLLNKCFLSQSFHLKVCDFSLMGKKQTLQRKNVELKIANWTSEVGEIAELKIANG